MASRATNEASPSWADMDYFARQSGQGSVVEQAKRQFATVPKSFPTSSGMVLMMLIVALIAAAYNTANNILFLTLSLIVSCVILNWVLAWINCKDVSWKLLTEPHLRAGETTPIKLRVENGKKLVPSYSLIFRIGAEVSKSKERLTLRQTLSPQQYVELEWHFAPEKRGRETVFARTLETQFPFGFFRRVMGPGEEREVIVWPKRIAYSFNPQSTGNAMRRGDALRRKGEGAELINLRHYNPGDPPRMVHWKASAKQRKIMVRQTSEENQEAYLLFLETPQSIWSDSEQFEVLCRLASSLAEDLFMDGMLYGIAVNDAPIQHIQRMPDLQHAMERIATLEPSKNYAPMGENAEATVITFKPGTGDRVELYVGGNHAGGA